VIRHASVLVKMCERLLKYWVRLTILEGLTQPISEHPSARGDDVFWYRLPVNINRPFPQLKKSLCSVFFGDPSSPLQSEQQFGDASKSQNSTQPITTISSSK
jgi:hypothetical protein